MAFKTYKKNYVLDKFKNAVMAYALTKMSNWAKLCIRVRRDSDNAEQDFGFCQGYVDIQGILAFVGAGNGYICTWYNQIKGKSNCVIAVALDQIQIVNTGAWVSKTAKYACYEPGKSTLSLHDQPLAVNGRMSNLSAASYVVYKDDKTGVLLSSGYANDFVVPIKCSDGLMDFGWTNLSEIFWYLVSGGTSTDSRPAATLNSGVSYSFGTNMTASNIGLNCNNTGAKYIGSLKDMPRLVYYLRLSNCTNTTGSLSDLGGRLTFFFTCSGINITGDLADLGGKLTSTLLLTSAYITGSLAYLNGNLINILSLNSPYITGVYTPSNNNTTPIIFSIPNTGLSAADVDNTIIACANPAVVKNGVTFTWTGLSRTAASDAAKLDLKNNHGWTFVPDT